MDPEPVTRAGLLGTLEALLLAKAREIQHAGRLGEALLQQQATLEHRIQQLDEVDAAVTTDHARLDSSDLDTARDELPLGHDTKRKLHALEQEMREWDHANEALYHGLAGQEVVLQQSPPSSPLRRPTSAIPPDSAPPMRRPIQPMSSRPNLSQSLAASGDHDSSADTSAATSRRTRNNTQHRTNDIALATEIGTSLLQEVKRLQGLLTERDELLKEATSGRDVAEKRAEDSENLRKTVDESIDKYKEENWNLEVVSEEMRAQLGVAQAAVAKSDLDRTRLAKDLATARDQLDTQRSETDKLTLALETLKGRFDTEMAVMRKHSAGLQRDKSDLMGTLDGMRNELTMRSRGLKRSNSTASAIETVEEEPSPEIGDEEAMFGRERGGRRKTGDGVLPPSPSDLFSEFGEDDAASPESSPAFRQGSLPNLTDAESLRASLAHAQRTIATLRSSLAKEKGKNPNASRTSLELNGLDEWDEGDSETSSTYGTPARSPVPRSVRGSARGARGSARRGTGRKSVGVPSRLGREYAGDDSIDEDDEEVHDSFADTGIFEHQFVARDDDEISESGSLSFDSPLSSRRSSHRISADMNPDFANMLEANQCDSRSILSHGSSADSPYATASLANASHNRSSIGSFNKSNRPTSGMFDGSGMGMREGSAATLITAPPAVVMVDCETMTDFVDLPLPVPIPVVLPPPAKETKEAGVQMSPVPVVTSWQDFSAQTDPVVVPQTSIGVSTDPLPPSPVLVAIGTSTDPAPATVAAGTSTDPIAVKQLAEMGTSTDAPAQRIEKFIQTDAAAIPILVTSPTVVTDLAGRIHAPRGEQDAKASAETETDGGETDFQDAEEIIPPPPRAVRDFFVAKSAKTSPTRRRTLRGYEQDSESEVEAQPARLDADATIKLARSVEAGVQTDAVAAPPLRMSPFRGAVLLPSVPNRQSINTFGRPHTADDDLETSAALAAAYAAGQGDTSRPTSGKGKGPAVLMGPPLSRNKVGAALGPRRSAGSVSVNSSRSSIVAPARPTSPPPADLLFRAQSPAFDSDYEQRARLFVPGMQGRSQGASMPPASTSRSASAQNLRGNAVQKKASMAMSDYGTPANRTVTPRRLTNASSATSDSDRRGSVESSRSESDVDGYATPVRAPGDSTDPQVIHAITQTMIGEFLHKYTRRTLGKGTSDKRHKRFFWVHPYTKTLYWSSADPGAQGTNQSSAKSVFITGVRQVIDSNPFPPGLHSGSIIVKTPLRDIIITASTRERHDMWFNAINYLLARPDVSSPQKSSATVLASPVRAHTSHRRYMSDGVPQTPSVASTVRGNDPTSSSRLYNFGSVSESRLGTASRSKIAKRDGTAAEEFGRQTGLQSTPKSTRTYRSMASTRQDREDEQPPRQVARNAGQSEAEEDLFEGLENVRACCNGKHDVGSLSRGGGHVHSHSHSDAEGSDVDFVSRTPSRYAKSSYSTNASARRSKTPTPVSQGVTPLSTNSGTVNGRRY